MWVSPNKKVDMHKDMSEGGQEAIENCRNEQPQEEMKSLTTAAPFGFP